MGQNTRIQNRFTVYTLMDRDCRYCLYYAEKRKSCTIKKCCCKDEIEHAITAIQRKEGIINGSKN